MGLLKKTTTGTNTAVLSVEDLRQKYGFHFTDAQNAYFTNMISVAEKACANYLGMEALMQTITWEEIFETAKGQRYVILSASPLNAVSKVIDNGEEISSYEAFPQTNVVLLSNGASGSEVRVQYTTGWTSAPEDVVYCVAMTVQAMSRMANAGHMGKTSQSTEGGTEQIEQSVVPLAIRQHLDRYRLGRASD